MNHKLLKLLIFSAILSASCNPPAENTLAVADSGAMLSKQESVRADESAGAPVSERKLIKEGEIEFETDNLDAAREDIYTAVDEFKGYIASEQVFNSPGRTTNTLTVRVPAADFDSFLAAASRSAQRLERKNIRVNDVTEEYLDVEARLKTKQELEARYRSLLSEAKNVSEILEIERELNLVRSEVESMEGRMKFLNNQVAFSTLSISMYQVLPDENKFTGKFGRAFHNGWNNLIWFFVLLANIWPFLLIGLGVLTGVLYFSRRKPPGKW